MPFKLICLAILNLITITLLSTFWEYGLEKYTYLSFGLAYDTSFEEGERLRFILTSTSFAALAMIIPGMLIAGLIRQLQIAKRHAMQLAYTDELTGSGNRRAFNAQIKHLNLQGESYALLLIDVNDFKVINDMYGHQQGDSTLVTLVDLLRQCADSHTCIFRIGGDEFAVVRGMKDGNDITSLSETILSRAAEVKIGGTGLMSLSIGLAYSTDCMDCDIIQAADLAMYEAKRDKTAHLKLFTPQMAQQFRATELFEYSVFDAVKKKAIVPFLQPIISLKTGELAGFELLARWTLTTGDQVSPEIFIPVVEKLGLVDQLTIQLLESVTPLSVNWAAGLSLCVNITPGQLLRPALTERLYEIMNTAGPVRLELEITEKDVMSISGDARLFIEFLKTRNIGVTMDDFGTGYSNLSVLLALGINKIKIDRSFIMHGLHNTGEKKVVETLLTLCRELNVEVTAEGIEDLGTFIWLKEQGCDYGQGYLFSKAIPACEATATSQDLIRGNSSLVISSVMKSTY